MRWNDFYEEERLKKPVYNGGARAAEISALLSELEERDGFSYDPQSDPLFRQYEQQYRREGSRAVDDTLAEAASHAGGMNSYAVTAAQQAGDAYSARLMDRLPELAALAYEMYQSGYDRELERLDRLQEQEQEEYARYQDALAEWYDRQDTAYQRYRDAVKDGTLPSDGGAGTAEKDAADPDGYQQAQDAARPGDRVERGRDTDGRTYDNGSLTRAQVAELQNYFEVDADGLWGKQSVAASGGQTAEQAWEEYRRLTGRS